MKRDSKYATSVNDYATYKIAEYNRAVRFFELLEKLTSDFYRSNFAFIIYDRQLKKYYLFHDDEQLLDMEFNNCDIFYGINNDKEDIITLLNDHNVEYKEENLIDIEIFMSATFGYISDVD